MADKKTPQDLHSVGIPMTRRRLQAVASLAQLMGAHGERSMGHAFARAIEQVYGAELDEIEAKLDRISPKGRKGAA